MFRFYLLALAIAGSVVAFTTAMHATSLIPDLIGWLHGHDLYPNILTIAWYGFAARQPLVLRVFIFAGAPTIAALVVTGSRKDLLSRLRPWRAGVSPRSAALTYAAIFAVYFAVFGVYCWITGHVAPAILWWALIGAFIDEGGTLEELGWRGFAFPRLRQYTGSPLRASVILGVLWTAWHLPREVPALLAGGVNWREWLPDQAEFALLCIALSIVSGYLVNRTGGSVIPAILAHGGSNVWSKAVGAAPNQLFHTDVRTVIIVVIAVLIVAFTDFRRSYTRSRPGEKSLPPNT